MSRTEPTPRKSGGSTASLAGLAEFVELLPFPALAVTADARQVLHANQAAAFFHATTAEAGYATQAGGERIESAQLLRHLAEQGSGHDGVDISWQGGAEVRSYRVYCRTGKSAGWSLLTFLDETREKAAQAELRAALEARDEFFSVATHELKDPIFSLQLSIQLLSHASGRLGAIPAHVQRHLDVSQRQAERLLRLAENLLDVSRIMNHRVRLDVEALDLCEVARETVARLQDKARLHGSSMELEAPEPIVGYFDRLKLEQVLANLLNNAIKYGNGQPIEVRVHGSADEASIEVEDHGIGIAPADQARIFHPFERAADGHKRESLGLGLYIVRSLVEAHGGTIGLESEVDRGTTITVILPRKNLHRFEAEDENSASDSTGA